MPTVCSIKIDYAQFEWHVRKLKKFLIDGAFSCQVCKKVFANSAPENAMKHLLRHLDDHSLYPYKCAHDGCDYTSITEGEVEHHVTSEHQAVWTEDVKRQCTHAENKARLDALCDEVKAMLRRRQLLLPSENVLDVLRCLDFASLLALQRSGSAFYAVVHRNLTILPRLRVFEFYLDLATGDHDLREVVGDTRDTVLSRPSVVPCTDEFDYSMLRPIADAVGTNFIDCLIISSTKGEFTMDFNMRKAIEALPALKHVRKLLLDCRCLMHATYYVDMDELEELPSSLDNLQYLELRCMNDYTDWAFLRKEWALRLRSLSVVNPFIERYAYGEYGHPVDASVYAEILEYCTDFVHLPQGKSKKVKIFGCRISRDFLQRIIAAVSECKDWLTVVFDGAPGFLGNDADYARCEAPREHPEGSRSGGVVRYSSRDGTHRIFVTSDKNPTIAVTNNPFVTTLNDAHTLDTESF